MEFRLAQVEDAASLLNIYGQYIDTPITFECTLTTVEEFENRIRSILELYPYLVCEEQGKIIGYAYAHRQMEREAYQWNVELSVYLDQNFTSKGIGKRLCQAVLELLRLQGVKNVYSLVVCPNPQSEGLHKALGFGTIGIHRNTGYKAGAWRDVVWFDKALSHYGPDPAPIIPLNQLDQEIFHQVLSYALRN